MGYIVENNVLITALELELENLRSNVDVLYKTKLKKFRIPSQKTSDVDNPWVQLTLEDGQEFSTRLLVRLGIELKAISLSSSWIIMTSKIFNSNRYYRIVIIMAT